MKAVNFSQYGTPDELRVSEVATPSPGLGQVLIKVHAAGVNPADWKWRAGWFAAHAPVALPHIPGYDVAGTIEQVGPDVTGFAPGDRVFAMLDAFTKGGYAQYAACDVALVARVPAGMDFPTAAALPTPGLTGCQMIAEHLPKGSGPILITGACGAVGRFALYQARQLGVRCIAAVRASQIDQALALGADEAIALDDPATPIPSVGFIADTVGGAQVARLAGGLAAGGKIITVSPTPIPPEGLATTPVFIAVHPDAAMLERIAGAVAQGEITLADLRLLPLADAAEAHRRLEAGAVGAKLILQPQT
ncbi:MAG: NADP-dependent oxidoreductase [Novosphingobium sp.]